MNWQYFKTFIWLRWRLQINQMRRAGVANVIAFGIFAVAAILAGIAGFFLALTVGGIALAEASPVLVMMAWDGVLAAFLFFWLIGLISELQRSELLSFEKFLHLPIKPTPVFLMNYASSLISLSLIVFVPAMVGLAIASVYAKGAAMLALFPMLAGFFAVVTALTYQLQGWLSTLMANKRKRRAVVAAITFAFILVAQIPNMLNFSGVFGPRQTVDALNQMQKELNELAQSLSLGQIDKDEYDREKAAIVESYERQQQEQDRAERNEVERILSVANQAVPLAWPAYGARRAAEGALLPALLASVGLALIAGASLWRAYGVTVRLYTGQFNAGKVPAEATPVAKSAAEPEKSPAARSSSTLIEKRLPWISEQASAIAVSCFRSLTRAPEVKMLLMSPLILVVVFGGLFVKAGSAPSEFARPLVAAGAICMILLGVSQLAGNQFGFDRSGFRVFVLASASRKDILLGKNLSLAPLVVGLCFFVTLVLQFIFPMRLDHFVATLAQAISMYFVYCFVANWLSMFAPMPVASGALRPTQTKGMALLMGFAFIFVFPPAMAITLIPLGIELWLDWTGWSSAFPIYLVCALVECAGVVFLYGKALRWQGNILQSREQKILEIVTSKAE